MRCSPTPLLATVLGAVACQGAPPATTEPSTGASEWTCSSRVELSSVWTFLRQRHDLDGDGRILATEYSRGEVRFANYDRDGDGILTAADFPADTWFNGFNHMITMRADTNEDERVDRDEWTAFGASMDPNGDGEMTAEEVGPVLGRWVSDWQLFLLSFDQDGDGDFDATDLDITFKDQDYNGDGVLVGKETSGWRPTAERRDVEPPEVGEAAPRFVLPWTTDPEASFDLDAAIGPRPVALVFGSYT